MGKRKHLYAEKLKEKRRNKVYAKLKYVRISPRKMRLFADLIRGMEANKAMAILQNSPHKAARIFKKLLSSALNNWEQKRGEIPEDIYIKEVYVDGAGMLKRIRPRAQGRAFRIRKRLSHATIVLDSASASADNLVVTAEDNENQNEQ